MNLKARSALKLFNPSLEKTRPKTACPFRSYGNWILLFPGKNGSRFQKRKPYGISLHFLRRSNAEKADFLVGVIVPVTTVCPCSREISKFGAHNQRSMLQQKFVLKNSLDWRFNKNCGRFGSGEYISLLETNRRKIRHGKGLWKSKFVEDVVRSVAVKLNKDNNFIWYCVEAEKFWKHS